MPKIEKHIKKILQNPTDVGFEELKRILIFFGYVARQPRGGSSHYIFTKQGERPLSIPKHKPIKKHYVKDVIIKLQLKDYLNDN